MQTRFSQRWERNLADTWKWKS